MSTAKNITAGAAAGAVATVAMLGVTAAARAVGFIDRRPQDELVQRILVPGRVPRTGVADGAQLVLGIASGAVYGATGGHRRRTLRTAAAHGIRHQLLAVLIGGLAWPPSPMFTADAPTNRRGTWTLLASHVVFGAVLGVVARRATRAELRARRDYTEG